MRFFLPLVRTHGPTSWPTRSFRTSPSAIARYFFHDCERFLRFLAASAELRRKEGLPEVEFDHSPLIRALLDSGYAWEETVLQQYAGVDVLVGPVKGRAIRGDSIGNRHCSCSARHSRGR